MTIWRGKDPLILASQSRARKMLLANAGIDFEAVPADIDERGVQTESGLSAPGEIGLLLAREKALFVSSQRPARYVVGAYQLEGLGVHLFERIHGDHFTILGLPLLELLGFLRSEKLLAV
jgi:septum formation protein